MKYTNVFFKNNLLDTFINIYTDHIRGGGGSGPYGWLEQAAVTGGIGPVQVRRGRNWNTVGYKLEQT